MDEISEHLPVWIQITLATAAFLGTAFAAFQGYTKKHFTEDEPKSKPQGGDTVVISAALADGAAIRELTSAIKGLHTLLETLVDVTESGNVKTDRLVSSSEEVEKQLRNLAQRVDDAINGRRRNG